MSGPINIGNPGEFTVRELADIVLDAIKSDFKIVHLPLPKDDPRQRRPDIAKAREILKWEPRIPLRAGLAKTIAYFAETLRVPTHSQPAMVEA